MMTHKERLSDTIKTLQMKIQIAKKAGIPAQYIFGKDSWNMLEKLKIKLQNKKIP